MATRFELFLTFADDVYTHVRELVRRLQPLLRGERLTPTMSGAIETAAENLAGQIDVAFVEERPRDATEEEWNAPVVAMLRARIRSIELVASQRPSDLTEWMRELALACEEFERAYREFDEKIER